MPLNIAYGLLSGLTLGIGFVVLQERSNQNLRHPGEAALRLGVPELGVIASIGDDLVKTKALRLYKSPAAVEDRLSVFGATEEESQAPTTDDFRTLLTSILFSGDKGRPSKVILITSAVPQDGKTTIAANLAVAFARSGKRVLLVDGDLRSPQIHKLFGVPNVIGLRNLLQSSATVEQAQHVLLNTSIARLSVLTSGSFTEAPADLLFEPHLRLLFAAYRERFDMVIVDSPPMMRMPDARLLGRVADGVVLVARSNRTSRDSILMACHRLTLDRTRVLGVVLNDWKGERSPYPYPS
jgi:capsular exopolysaccharide synthesis family protein